MLSILREYWCCHQDSFEMRALNMILWTAEGISSMSKCVVGRINKWFTGTGKRANLDARRNLQFGGSSGSFAVFSTCSKPVGSIATSFFKFAICNFLQFVDAHSGCTHSGCIQKLENCTNYEMCVFIVYCTVYKCICCDSRHTCGTWTASVNRTRCKAFTIHQWMCCRTVVQYCTLTSEKLWWRCFFSILAARCGFLLCLSLCSPVQCSATVYSASPGMLDDRCSKWTKMNQNGCFVQQYNNIVILLQYCIRCLLCGNRTVRLGYPVLYALFKVLRRSTCVPACQLPAFLN